MLLPNTDSAGKGPIDTSVQTKTNLGIRDSPKEFLQHTRKNYTCASSLGKTGKENEASKSVVEDGGPQEHELGTIAFAKHAKRGYKRIHESNGLTRPRRVLSWGFLKSHCPSIRWAFGDKEMARAANAGREGCNRNSRRGGQGQGG